MIVRFLVSITSVFDTFLFLTEMSLSYFDILNRNQSLVISELWSLVNTTSWHQDTIFPFLSCSSYIYNWWSFKCAGSLTFFLSLVFSEGTGLEVGVRLLFTLQSILATSLGLLVWDIFGKCDDVLKNSPTILSFGCSSWLLSNSDSVSLGVRVFSTVISKLDGLSTDTL